MAVSDLLEKSLAAGVILRADNGRLVFEAKPGAITDDLRTELRAHKSELIDYLTQVCQSQTSGHVGIKLPPLEKMEKKSAYLPLSYAQQRMWFLDLFDHEASVAYHLPISLHLKGVLQLDVLRRALDRLLFRHDSLRTTFSNDEGVPFQVVAEPNSGFDLRVYDLRGSEIAWVANGENELVAQHCQSESVAPFDLTKGPLIRGMLLRVGVDEHVMLINQHHIISDGWSIGNLIHEVATLYAAFSQGLADPLPPLAIQYSDYVLWQKQWLQGELLYEQIAFWREHLLGAPDLLELPLDHPRPLRPTFTGSSIEITLPSRLTSALRALANRHDCTLFMVLLAAWSLLLARLSGEQDVVIGIPVANRRCAELEPLIGFFVNTLALRVKLHVGLTVADLLAQVRLTALSAFDHQDLPFEQLVEALQPTRSTRYNPLFQVAFSMQNLPAGNVSALQELSFNWLESPTSSAIFDLSLQLHDADTNIIGTINYATDLFEQPTITRWSSHFEVLLDALCIDARQCVMSLPLLSADERNHVLIQLNATRAAFPKGILLHELFERQASIQPQATALICENVCMSYGELNQRANRMAHYLLMLGVKADDRVALYLERDSDLVIALLGILKAGAAYLPLDPGYPLDRVKYMLNDAAPKAVLTKQSLSNCLPGGGWTVLLLDNQQMQRELFQLPTINTDSMSMGLTAQHLAYIIYTSGSTGLPKGVAIEHRNVTNLIHWAQIEFPVEMIRQTLFSTSLNFDLSVFELFLPLSLGATVNLVANSLVAKELITGITLMNTVPSAVMARLDTDGLPMSLTHLNVAGEALRENLVQRVFAESDVKSIANLYGPTETTTYSTWNRIGRGEECVTHIGRPIANTQVYILDCQRAPLPIGVMGEIYIAGEGVARGYLNRPELTAERFLIDPFCSAPNARMYKTGDLGRWLPDGNIEYLGRNDFQVKVRGYRIELGEIEARIANCHGVSSSVVIVREDVVSDQRLVAYIVPIKGHELLPTELRAQLAIDLPDYMIPNVFVCLDHLPLTPNGKVDRKALPKQDMGPLRQFHDEAPDGEMENAVAQIWRNLLQLERFGRQDNFFELGGHSLLAVQMISQLRRSLGMEVPLRNLFAAPVFAAFTASLSERYIEKKYPNLVPIRTQGSQSPLFLVHPGEGEVGYARELAQWLDRDIPVYGIAASGFLEDETASDSIAEMASRYVTAIRHVQPHGPYRLAGWSAGGTIAYEMATQLIGADEYIDFIGMIDTLCDYRSSFLTNANFLESPQYFRPLTDSFRAEIRYLIEHVGAGIADDLKGALDAMAAQGNLDGMIVLCQKHDFLPANIDVQTVRRHLSVRAAMRKALLAYSPLSIPFHVTLFTAKENLNKTIHHSLQDLGWGRVCQDRLHLVPVAGNHYSLMNEPNIQPLAQALMHSMNTAKNADLVPDEFSYSPLMSIQSGTTGAPPIFCVHGAGANVTDFCELADSLGTQYSVYGLQARGLEGVLVPHSDVVAAARTYVAALRKVQPFGPYRLFGHSFGGWLVFEMALQLSEAGDTVSTLVVLDSESPVTNITDRHLYRRSAMLMKLVELFEMSAQLPLNLTESDFLALDDDGQIALLWQRLVAVRLFSQKARIESLYGIVRLFNANINTRYVPGRVYEFPMHLIQAKPDSVQFITEAILNNAKRWRKHAPELTSHDVPGDHMTMLGKPNVHTLADKIRPLLS